METIIETIIISSPLLIYAYLCIRQRPSVQRKREVNNLDRLKYELETLASCRPADIDSPEFEVCFVDECGREGYTTVCCIDLARRALKRIEDLEKALLERIR